MLTEKGGERVRATRYCHLNIAIDLADTAIVDVDVNGVVIVVARN